MYLGCPGRNKKIFNQSWSCCALCKGEVWTVTRRNHHHISEREGKSPHIVVGHSLKTASMFFDLGTPENLSPKYQPWLYWRLTIMFDNAIVHCIVKGGKKHTIWTKSTQSILFCCPLTHKQAIWNIMSHKSWLHYLHISFSSTVRILTEEIVSSFPYSCHQLRRSKNKVSFGEKAAPRGTRKPQQTSGVTGFTGTRVWH